MQNTPNNNQNFDPFGGSLFDGIEQTRHGAKWQSANIEVAQVRRHGPELRDLRQTADISAVDLQPEQPAVCEIEQIAAALEEAVAERSMQLELAAELPEHTEDTAAEEISLFEELVAEESGYAEEPGCVEEPAAEETPDFEELVAEEAEYAEEIEFTEELEAEETPDFKEIVAEEGEYIEEPAAEESLALVAAGKTMTIQGQLIRSALAEVAAEQQPREPMEDAAAHKEKSAPRRKRPGRFTMFKRIGAAVALFAMIGGSVAYYGSMLKYTGEPDPGAVAYLSMEDHVRRTSADSQVLFMGESELRQVFLTGSSAEEDLNLVVTDINGEKVSGTPFSFKIIDPEGGESYYTDEDMDGELSIDDLPEGDYGVEMQQAEGFVVPGAIVVTVAGKIEYVKIENISEIIVDQSEINIEEEDLMAGGRPAEETPPVVLPENGNTVEFVESSKQEVEEERTRTVTKFRGNIDSASGRLYYADGTLSNVIPVVDASGYLTGEYTIWSEVYTITVASSEGGTAAAAAASSKAFESIAITATPSEGYSFAGWSASSAAAQITDAANASTTFLMPAENVTITANFTAVEPPPAATYTLTVAGSTGGSAAAADGSTTVTAKAGDQISIAATPEGGYLFSGWTLSGGTVVDAAGAATVFTMPEGDATVTATFAVDTTGGGTGGDINLFAKDQAGKYIYGITAETLEEKYTEKVTKFYGWQTIDGNKYYYDKDGNMITGSHKIQGVSYMFGPDGILATSDKTVMGIDVSTWQPNVDWNKVKASGIEYVIIRCGFRGYGSGKIVEDDCFRKHIEGAKAAGLRVGVYFFSQAINTTEAVEEASAMMELVKGYSIDYPLVLDMEDAGAASARTNGLTKAELTKIAVAFGETCRSSGYSAMIYANKYWLEYKLDTSQLSNYYIWLAHYTGGSVSSYKGRYEMWQYTGSGSVPGISGPVDMNYSYMG